MQSPVSILIGKLDIFSLISLSDIVSITHSDSDTGKYC
jgi:hypothetical protein